MHHDKKFFFLPVLLLMTCFGSVDAWGQSALSVAGKTYKQDLGMASAVTLKFHNNGTVTFVFTLFGQSQSAALSYKQNGGKIYGSGGGSYIDLMTDDGKTLSGTIDGRTAELQCMDCSSQTSDSANNDSGSAKSLSVAGKTFSHTFKDGGVISWKFRKDGQVEMITSKETNVWPYTQDGNRIVVGGAINLHLTDADTLIYDDYNVAFKNTDSN